tara:strand:- start:181 stop:918 length:738 start_codon:yes stop_codon:yes gene_type:complete
MSRLLRVFVPEDQSPADGIFTIGGEEARHLLKVLRVEVGRQVEVLNGKGLVWLARVNEVSARSIVLKIEEIRETPQPAIAFEVAMALPKAGRMEETVRQLTELGVSRITPILAERGEVGKLPGRIESKLEKWNRIAVQASKQSGNPWLPNIGEPIPFKFWCEGVSKDSCRLLGSLSADARSISSVRKPSMKSVCIGIGPEGGFSKEEEDHALALGFVPVRLGSHVLRIETAAVCALAVAQEVFAV